MSSERTTHVSHTYTLGASGVPEDSDQDGRFFLDFGRFCTTSSD